MEVADGKYSEMDYQALEIYFWTQYVRLKMKL